MAGEKEVLEERAEGGPGTEPLYTRFIKDHTWEIAKTSLLWGTLLLVGAGLTALFLSGAPSYSEAGGLAKALVWLVWLAVFGTTVAYKWRTLRASAEAKGYSWEELLRTTMREYMPVGVSAALLGVAMTMALLRLDHAEYLLGLWLMAWGCAVVAMGGRWAYRPISVLGAAMLALGFLQALLWPAYVLSTVVLLGLFWLVAGGYFWYAS